MKRQRGRGRKPGGGGGGSHNHGNRSLESNGPDVKIRGTAAQIYEKYSQYARDSQSAGDRVKYENFLQHAEHYFRIMVATMPRDRLFQQQGEGGMALSQEHAQSGAEGGQPQAEGGASVDVAASADAMKVMDDQSGEDDGDDEDDREEDLEASSDDNREQQDDRQGNRRRRRGRRRPADNQQNASTQTSSNGDSEPREPRSALDSLARRQGAIAGG